MSVLVVVVIVGVIAAIAVATLAEPPQPATRQRTDRRDPPPPAPEPPPVIPPQPVVEPEPDFEPAFASPPEPEPELDPVWADDPSPLEPAFPAPEAELEAEPAIPGLVASIPDDRRWRHRIRSAGLLGVAVAVLGALTAASLGVTALLGYRFLDRALG